MRGGFSFTELSYTIDGNQITFEHARAKNKFDDRYMIILKDQKDIRGNIRSNRDEKTFIISNWVKEDELTHKTVEAIPMTKGKGVVFDLSLSDKVKDKQGQTIGETLKDVLLGLAPNNIVKAMAETKILPIIVFAMIFGAILTTLGEQGQTCHRFFYWCK